MNTPEPSHRLVSQHGAAAAIVVSLLVGANALSEVLVTPHFEAIDLLRPTLTLVFMVWLPITLLARCIRALPHRFGAIAFWFPLFLGLGFLGQVAMESTQSVAVLGVIAGVGAGAALANRFLSWLRPPKTGQFSAVSTWWVLLTFFLTRDAGDLSEGPGAMQLYLPILAGVAGVGTQIVSRQISESPRWNVLGWVMVVAAFPAIWMLQTWLPELNLQFKAWIALSMGVGVQTLTTPYLARRLAPRLPAAGIAVVLAALFGVVVMTQDVPDRFGAVSLRSTSGSVIRALSILDDADGDGFYASSAGGNDCDDHNAHKHPAAIEASKNCWAESAVKNADVVQNFTSDDVFVFVIDAMRADTLTSKIAPNLAQFAARSSVFTQAWAPGNSTFLSLPTMLSGVSPVAAIQAMPRDAEISFDALQKGRTLFDITPNACHIMLVQAHGYADWLFNYYPRPELRSFDVSTNETGHGAPLVPKKLQDALSQCGERPVVAVVYMDDPHIEQPELKYTCQDGSRGGRECYEDEIRGVDRALGEMLTAIRKRSREAMIVVTADHGEAFGEHRHTSHTSSVFEEQIHVPLVVFVPGEEHRVISQPTSLLGLPAMVEANARDITPVNRAHGDPLACSVSAPCLAPVAHNWIGFVKRGWTPPTSATTDGRYKLIYNWRTHGRTLFDLKEDPLERHPLTHKDEVSNRLFDLLRATMATELAASEIEP